MAAENLLEHFQNGPDGRISLPELKLAFAAATAAAVCESIHSCETWNWRRTEKVLQLLILQNLALWNFTVNFICGSSAGAASAFCCSNRRPNGETCFARSEVVLFSNRF